MKRGWRKKKSYSVAEGSRFQTESYFYKNLIPSLRLYAEREQLPTQASWLDDIGVWKIVNAANQPTRRAWVIMDVDGTWREGPMFDASKLSGPGAKRR